MQQRLCLNCGEKPARKPADDPRFCGCTCTLAFAIAAADEEDATWCEVCKQWGVGRCAGHHGDNPDDPPDPVYVDGGEL